jgi:hypothetical protein
MRVVLLEVVHYPPDGSHWHAVETPDPDWPAIEAAVRRLDRDEWPFLWLHTVPPVEGEMPENGLCVMGGRGEYSLFLSGDGGEVHYEDASRGSTQVRIWESDQGSEVEERSLCNDLGRVLAIARHFAAGPSCTPTPPGSSGERRIMRCRGPGCGRPPRTSSTTATTPSGISGRRRSRGRTMRCSSPPS